jgi:Xaa-Pro aminopeptidase
VSRLDVCLELMADDDVDALFLGREANARTVSDAARLWLAGTRTFSPGCVVVRASGAVHLLANTDAVVPADFPVDHLYGVTWNPEKLLAALCAIDGVRTSRRIAVDGMTPAAYALLARAAPDAEVVDAGPIFARMWAMPEEAKTVGVSRAADTAAAGLAAMATALVPGARPEKLRGLAAATLAQRGAPTPAFEAVAAAFAAGESTWLPPARQFAAGEKVVLRAGALHDGWEASLARTYVVGQTDLAPAPAGWIPLVAACVPGTQVGTLRERGAVVWGLGRGIEPWPDDVVLVPGLNLALELQDDTALRQDVVHVGTITGR